jgi:hypothetical protein
MIVVDELGMLSPLCAALFYFVASETIKCQCPPAEYTSSAVTKGRFFDSGRCTCWKWQTTPAIRWFWSCLVVSFEKYCVLYMYMCMLFCPYNCQCIQTRWVSLVISKSVQEVSHGKECHLLRWPRKRFDKEGWPIKYVVPDVIWVSVRTCTCKHIAEHVCLTYKRICALFKL